MLEMNQEQNLRDRVFQICESLAKNNKKINREVVREKLGGGSFSTISPLVSEWKELKYKGITNDTEIRTDGTNTRTVNHTDSTPEHSLEEGKDTFVPLIESTQSVPLINECTDVQIIQNGSTNGIQNSSEFCTQDAYSGSVTCTDGSASLIQGTDFIQPFHQSTDSVGIEVNSTLNQSEISNQNASSGEIVKLDNGELTQSQSVDSLSSEEINDYLPEEDLNYITRSGAEKALGLLAAQDALAMHFYKNPNDLPSDLKEKYLEFRRNFSQLRGTVHGKAYSPQNLINLATKQLEKSKQV